MKYAATNLPAVITTKRADDWSAAVRHHPGQWAAGRTEAEALGRLLIDLLAMDQQECACCAVAIDSTTICFTLDGKHALCGLCHAWECDPGHDVANCRK